MIYLKGNPRRTVGSFSLKKQKLNGLKNVIVCHTKDINNQYNIKDRLVWQC